MKNAILFVNLGTPQKPDPESVGNYLAEFLMDPKVIGLPFLLRWILVKCIIVPFRKKNSAQLYRNIWTQKGSPLLVHTQNLLDKTRKTADSKDFYLAMRYGGPSISDVLDEISNKNYRSITLVPLYPQFAQSTTLSTIYACRSWVKSSGFKGSFSFIKDFHSHTGYIDSLISSLKESIKKNSPDHVVISFHSCPVLHLKRYHPEKVAKSSYCCDRIGSENVNCYRAQCMDTAQRIKDQFESSEITFEVGFQSRLGKTPWVKPYTREVLEKIGENGGKKVLVICPSFVSDCLETLEEIGIGEKKYYESKYGGNLTLVSALNDSDDFVNGLLEIVNSSKKFDLFSKEF